jgi:hypothetical protein
MTVIGARSSFRELGEMSPHKRASSDRCIAGEMPTSRYLSHVPIWITSDLPAPPATFSVIPSCFVEQLI